MLHNNEITTRVRSGEDSILIKYKYKLRDEPDYACENIKLPTNELSIDPIKHVIKVIYALSNQVQHRS